MPDRQKEHYEAVGYHSDELLKNSEECERLAAIQKNIPQGTKTILDCGCASGDIGNTLIKHYDVQGCDIAAEPLKYCKFPTKQCTLSELPYQNRQFDLVICSEVLEHIFPLEYQKACSEIQRVCSKWLLITVPNREEFDYARQQCPHCGTIFHDAWHIRHMDEKAVTEAFPQFTAEKFFYIGHKQRFDLMWRRKLTNKLFGYPPLRPNRHCPLCQCMGTKDGLPQIRQEQSSGKLVSRSQWYQSLRSMALKIVPGRSRWLGALLKRKTS